uniref:Internal head protein n=1 Tax=Pseudomonas phage RVTF4 TaxID=3236931 RepID=A0AB39CCY5_9VIRU
MTDITFKQVDHDLGTLHQQTVALEGFHRWVVGHGAVTGDVARVIRVALEDSDPDDISKGVTGKDLVTGIKKVSVTIRNIVQWLLRQIGKLIEKIGLGIQKLGNLGRDNEKKLKALGNDQAAKLDSGDVEVDPDAFNPAMLCITGKFVGHELEHAKTFTTVTRWFAKDFMDQMNTVLDNLEGAIAQHLQDESPDEFIKKAAQIISSTVHLPKVQMGGAAGPAEQAGSHTIHTVPLFGDIGMVMFDPSKASEGLATVESAREYLVFDFVEYNSKQETEFEKLPAPKSDVLLKLNQEMLDALEFWESNIKTSAARLRKTLEGVESSTSKIGTGDSAATAQATMGNIMATTIQRLGAGMDSGSKYLARTFNQELHYISTTIAATSK